MTLEELNALESRAAERELAKCCGSARWAAAVAARRPFESVARLQDIAEEVWWSLDGGDWLEAFSHHPRIGERAAGWARDEQSVAAAAPVETHKLLAELNHEYERRFGHVFLICATGKGADEITRELGRRMSNDPASELRVAAAEQAAITRLRLDRLVAPRRGASRTA